MATPFAQDFHVRSYETGVDGRLSVRALCDYLQEAAGANAEALGMSIADLGRRDLTWMLGRLQLEVEEMPDFRETVRVETWPSGTKSFFVLRDYRVWAGDGRPAARATSIWFVIDLGRRRAVRVPEWIRDLRIPPVERALSESWNKLPRLSRVDHERSFHIRQSDLDVNAHVNHVSYLEWAFETLPPEFQAGNRLRKLDIEFLAELTYGDSVLAQSQLAATGDDATEVCFRLAAASGGTEAARLHSLWVPAAGEPSEPVDAG